jgi:hypothetical protein
MIFNLYDISFSFFISKKDMYLKVETHLFLFENVKKMEFNFSTQSCA